MKRILIPYIAIGVIQAVLDKWTVPYFFLQLSTINFWKDNMYSFLWFGCAIIYFYLFFPFYYKFLEKAENKLQFTISVFEIWFIIIIVLSYFVREDLFGFINRFPVFLFGIYIGWLCKNKEVKLGKPFFVTMFFSFILGLILAALTTIKGVTMVIPVSNCSFPNMLLAVSMVFLLSGLFEVILDNKTKISIITKPLIRFLEFFGTISFELYCVQMIVATAVIKQIKSIVPTVVLSIAIFICSIVCAYVLWIIKEFILKGFEILWVRHKKIS